VRRRVGALNTSETTNMAHFIDFATRKVVAAAKGAKS